MTIFDVSLGQLLIPCKKSVKQILHTGCCSWRHWMQTAMHSYVHVNLK